MPRSFALFLPLQRLDLLMLHARQLAGIGRIEAQIIDCHRLLQCLVQHTMRSSRVPLSSTFPSSSLVLYSR